MKNDQTVKRFMLDHFKHFNAGALMDAAMAYEQQLANGHKMMITLAGAMSTAELGKSLAEMIRQEKIHALCCTVSGTSAQRGGRSSSENVAH